MMHLRFMSTCDLLLFLLSVSSAVIFFTFMPLSTFANTNLSVKGEGMSYWDDRTSKKDACDMAELEAKNDVLRQLGLERLKSNQVETCSDSGDKVNCELYQSTFNTISGGYIKNFDMVYSYDWPGNVRELRNLVERIAILGQDNMDKIKNLIYNYFNPSLNLEENKSISTDLTLKEARDNFEREYLIKQLKINDGNVSKTAKSVGMERSALHRKLSYLNIKY